MTIDPSTLAAGTVVEWANFYGDSRVTRAGNVPPGSEIVRTFSPDPLPSQEIPRDQWASIKPGSSVHVESNAGTILIGMVTERLDHNYNPHNGFRLDDERVVLFVSTTRVYLLDEAPDPDADLIERMAKALVVADGFEWPTGDDAREVWRGMARAALAVVREHEAQS